MCCQAIGMFEIRCEKNSVYVSLRSNLKNIKAVQDIMEFGTTWEFQSHINLKVTCPLWKFQAGIIIPLKLLIF